MKPAETYQERQAREKAEEAERRAWFEQLRAYLERVGWRCQLTHDDDAHAVISATFYDQSLNEPRPFGFHFYLSPWTKGASWEVRVNAPRDVPPGYSNPWSALGVLKYGEQAPHASGKPGRDVEAVARDINRRVVIPGRPMWAAALAAIDKREAQRKHYAEHVAQFMKRFKIKGRDGLEQLIHEMRTIHFSYVPLGGDSSFDVMVHPDTDNVTVKALPCMSCDELAAVLAVFRRVEP